MFSVFRYFTGDLTLRAPLPEANLAQRSSEKTDQRMYPFLGQLVARIRRSGRLDNDSQAIDQNSGGSTHLRDVEFAAFGTGFDYFSDFLQQKFLKITDTIPVFYVGREQQLKHLGFVTNVLVLPTKDGQSQTINARQRAGRRNNRRVDCSFQLGKGLFGDGLDNGIFGGERFIDVSRRHSESGSDIRDCGLGQTEVANEFIGFGQDTLAGLFAG